MKRISKSIIGAFLMTVISVSSCKKLDTYPITSYSEQNFWKHPNHANAALNGAYVLLQGALNTEFAYYGEFRADLSRLSLENTTQSINVANNRMDVNMGFADWGNLYKVVQQANLILKHLPQMLQTNLYDKDVASSYNEYKRIIGQAYALRALCYFYMIRIWGEVPLITEPVEVVDNINDFKTPRTPMADIHAQIIKDLETARDLLSSFQSYSDVKLTRSQITRGAVDAIFTDFYLWINDIPNALKYADNLINDSGNPVNTSVYAYTALTGSTAADRYNSEYAQMFFSGYSKESIFEIAFNNDENSTSGLYGIYGGSGQAQFRASNYIINQMASDPRKDVVFNTGTTKQYVYKFFEKEDYERTTMNDKNVIIYRLADICLLKAEALLKRGNSGDRDKVLVLLNKIKQRAGIAVIPTGDYGLMPNSEVLDEILLERAKELCFEGKRWFDLVRNNKAIEIMQPINGLSDVRNILWPINLRIIRQNPQIEQNDYYK